ncbi:MAG: thioredoxin, partial [Calditrichaeota bacterium]|nr:thioredoxin [Calditrichota bacterium]
MAYDVQNFQQEVIQKSFEKPVLVDFWAEWCGPCKILGPVLEKLAEKHNDKWVLAKVNTEVHQELAMQYGIRGIPNVKLFIDGQVTDEFTGAMPEAAIEQWLQKAIPSKFAQHVAQAADLLQRGDIQKSQEILE